MVRFVREFRLSPSEYWALTFEEDAALDAYLTALDRSRAKQAREAKRKRRRR